MMLQHLTQSRSSSSSSSRINNALPPPTPSAARAKGHTPTTPQLHAPALDLSQQRPKSSPARQSHTPSAASSSSPATATATATATSTSTFDFTVPRIAIFKEAFSFQSLRQRARLHRSPTPTLGDISSSSNYTKRQLSTTSLSSARSVSLASPTYTNESHSHSEVRLPSSKRPPASWSSHGIETSFGPPPALITRGSYNSDLARLAQSPAAATLAQQKHKPYNIKPPAKDTPTLTKQDSFITNDSQDAVFDGASSPLSPKLENPSYSHSLDAMMDRPSARTTPNGYLDDGASAYTDGPSPVQDGPSGGDTEDSGRSAEDLFLNLAEDSPADTRQYDTQSRLERRTVCLLLSRANQKP